jgi:hypothetical protein
MMQHFILPWSLAY